MNKTRPFFKGAIVGLNGSVRNQIYSASYGGENGDNSDETSRLYMALAIFSMSKFSAVNDLPMTKVVTNRRAYNDKPERGAEV